MHHKCSPKKKNIFLNKLKSFFFQKTMGYLFFFFSLPLFELSISQRRKRVRTCHLRTCRLRTCRLMEYIIQCIFPKNLKNNFFYQALTKEIDTPHFCFFRFLVVHIFEQLSQFFCFLDCCHRSPLLECPYYSAQNVRCQPMCLSVSLCVCLLMCLSVCKSVCKFVWSPMSLSVCLLMCISTSV
jgi:hypothetical protein